MGKRGGATSYRNLFLFNAVFLIHEGDIIRRFFMFISYLRATPEHDFSEGISLKYGAQILVS